MREEPRKRIVAIVGRPNVGKSTIFNRLAGRRIAIVHEQSGVTRDRLMCETSWGEERFDLVDTGGVCNIDSSAAQNEIEAGIRIQVESALADASSAMFVVDVESGVLPLDHEVAGLLRASGCFTVIAANKADNPGRDEDASEFEQFGFPVFPVSALHNRGFDSLMEVVVGALPSVDNLTAINPLKVSVVGRPNVGKSLYINRLLRSDRVIVSDVPGTTRDSIDIPFATGLAQHYILIDTAGLRRRSKVKTSIEQFSHFRAQKSISRADVVVLMLDAVQGPTAQDKKIASLVLEHEKGCLILINKWDLVEKAVTQRKYGSALLKTIPFMAHCPVVFVSAKTGYNIRHTVEAISHVASQIRTVIPTAILNKTILNACNRIQPPSIKGKRLKIFYATQTGCAPIRIMLFVNDPKRVRASYQDYLVRILREKFGFDGAPILLQFRSRRG